MVILHNAIKTIQSRAFVCFLKKEQKPVSLKKNKKPEFKITGGLEFFEKNVFFSTLTVFQSFFVIFP